MSQDLPNMVYLTNESAHGWYYYPSVTLSESKFIYSYEQQDLVSMEKMKCCIHKTSNKMN